jgi:hypothetical protein
VARPDHLRKLQRARQKLVSRAVWQRSFHSLPIDGEKMWLQKLEYIHHNPVRRGLCEAPQDFAWSSAQLWENGYWKEELIVPDAVIDEYWPSAVRDPLQMVVERLRATGGPVAR